MARRRTHYKKGPRREATRSWKDGVLVELKNRGIPVYKMERDLGAGESTIAKMLRSDEESTSAWVDPINQYLNRKSPDLTARQLAIQELIRELSPEEFEALLILARRILNKDRSSV